MSTARRINLEEENEELRQQLAHVRRLFEEASAERRALTADVQQLTEDLNQSRRARAKLIEENRELTDGAEDLDQDFEALEADLARVTAERESLAKDVLALGKAHFREVDELREKIAQLASESREILPLRDEVIGLRKQVKAARAQHQEQRVVVPPDASARYLDLRMAREIGLAECERLRNLLKVTQCELDGKKRELARITTHARLMEEQQSWRGHLVWRAMEAGLLECERLRAMLAEKKTT